MEQVQIPLSYQRLNMSLKAVRIRLLDENRKELAFGSGFIRRRDGQLYLYTCWHLETGIDRHDIAINNNILSRVFVSIEMQDVEARQPGIEVIGGLQTLTLPLFDQTDEPKRPLWQQDDLHIPQRDLNLLNVFVPFWHDVVRIPLPENVRTSEVQVIEQDNFSTEMVAPGEKLYLVGYPYSFSSYGDGQPTPVVLTRFVAAEKIKGRAQEILLDGPGVSGMSGGPIFIERESKIRLLGIYTGSIFPDHVIPRNGNPDKFAELGICSDLSFHLYGSLKLVTSPSKKHVTT